MARIDYSQITRAIRDVLEADADIVRANARVAIHEPVPVDMTRRPFVNIIEARRTPTPSQRMAAGLLTRYEVQWEVWVHCFSAEKQGAYEDAAAQRDELLGYVEVALTRNRSLRGVLGDSSLLLRGGELGGQAATAGFISSGQLVVTAEATIVG